VNPEEEKRRLDILKSLILQLHAGGDLKSLKKQFKELLADVEPTEIANMEQTLIQSGELTAEQITKLCDLHVGIFEDALQTKESVESTPGHPLHTYMEENKAVLKLIGELRKTPTPDLFDKLKQIEIHYTRLENQLFPKLEQVGFTGPSNVMWAKHDEIRAMIKEAKVDALDELLQSIEDMVFKEERILFPTALEKLSSGDWGDVKRGEEEIGFAWVTPGNDWQPVTPMSIHMPEKEISKPLIDLSVGKLSALQVDLLLKHLPMDLTYVDAEGKVAYYSDSAHRIFPRSAGIIGRKVENCHPPKSVHIVNQIVESFQKGEKDIAEFWFEKEGRFLHIRYYAVRDSAGTFQGTIEVSQDVTDIRKLQGEQRLLSWKS
jgi:DUF438 domain-containing protein